MPGPLGVVWYGAELDFDSAVAHRQAGRDVVVRGDDVDANRILAAAIEAAVGPRTGPGAAPSSGPSFPAPFSSGVAHSHRAQLLRNEQSGEESEETAMKYFTPDLLALLANAEDAVANAAEAEWERRLEAYEAELRRIEPDLPEHVREFNNLLLHDARVYSLARQGDHLILVLHKDVPPRDLVIITYALAGEPVIDREALPLETRSAVMDFDYDELAVVREGTQILYAQSILFSNGWEVRLRFRDVPLCPRRSSLRFPSPVRGAAIRLRGTSGRRP